MMRPMTTRATATTTTTSRATTRTLWLRKDLTGTIALRQIFQLRPSHIGQGSLHFKELFWTKSISRYPHSTCRRSPSSSSSTNSLPSFPSSLSSSSSAAGSIDPSLFSSSSETFHPLSSQQNLRPPAANSLAHLRSRTLAWLERVATTRQQQQQQPGWFILRSADELYEAQELILQWVKTEQSGGSSLPTWSRTRESVEMSFQLIEILVKSFAQQQQQLHDKDPNHNARDNYQNEEEEEILDLYHEILNRHLLHSAVLNWHAVGKQEMGPDRSSKRKNMKFQNNNNGRNNNSLFEHPDWSPNAMARRLDRLSSQGPRSSSSSSSSSSPLLGKTLSVLIDAAVKVNCCDLALELLRRIFADIEAARDNNNNHPSSYLFVPSTTTFNSVLFALARLGDLITIHSILQQAVQLGVVSVDIDSYNALLQAYAQTGQPRAAQALLEKLVAGESPWHVSSSSTSSSTSSLPHPNSNRAIVVKQKLNQSPRPPIVPNLRTFNTVIAAWSKSGDEEAPERAEAIVRRMLDPFDWGALTVNNTTITTNKSGARRRSIFVRHSNISSGDNEDDELDDGRQRRHGRDLHHAMAPTTQRLRPDVVTLNTVLTCWAAQASPQRPHAALRAQALLQDMQAWSSSLEERERFDLRGHDMDFEHDEIDELDYDDHGDDQIDRDIPGYGLQSMSSPKPDLFSHAIVLNALAKAGLPDAAQEVFQQAYEQFLHHGKQRMQPNLYLVTPLISAWMNVSSSPGQPALTARERLARAEQVWKQMQQLSEFGVMPALDVTSHKVMLQAYAQAKDVTGALKLLEDMKRQQVLTLTSTGCKPFSLDFDCYSILIHLLLSMADQPVSNNSRFSASSQQDQSLHAEVESGKCKQLANEYWEEVHGLCSWIASDSSKEANQCSNASEAFYPTQQSINSIARAFAKAGDFDRAETILLQLCDEAVVMHQKCNEVNQYAISSIEGKSSEVDPQSTHHPVRRNDHKLRREKLAPLGVAVTSVIAEMTRCRLPNLGPRAERLEKRFVQLYEKGVIEEEPDFILHRVLLRAWCVEAEQHKQRGAADAALRLLKHCQLKFGYYACSDENCEGDDFMLSREASHARRKRQQRLTTSDYNIVLRTLTRARRTPKADKLLEEMIAPHYLNESKNTGIERGTSY